MPSRSSGALAGGRAPSACLVPLPARMPGSRLPPRAAPSADLSDDAELHQLRDVLDHAAHAELGAPHGRPVACGTHCRLHGLGCPSCHLARQAGRTRRKGGPQVDPAGAVCPRCAMDGGHLRAMHRAAAPGSALQPGTSGSDGPSTSFIRRSCSSSNGGTTRRPISMASPGSMRQWSSSSRARSSTWQRLRTSWPQTRWCSGASWKRAARTSCRASAISWMTGERIVRSRPAAGTEAFQVGRDVAVTPGQGDLPQPAHRADPVCANDGQGPARADPDRARLDHEVLHPRPVPGRTPSSGT